MQNSHRELSAAIEAEEAVKVLSRGFIAHPANAPLRESLASGQLSSEEYYRQLLWSLYRLLFLFMAEDRGLLADGSLHEDTCSTAQLRRLAREDHYSTQDNLYQAVSRSFAKQSNDGSGNPTKPMRSCFPLSGHDGVLAACRIADSDLLEVVRLLALTREYGTVREVDYSEFGVEQLGGIHESLLELHPTIENAGGELKFSLLSGHKRKTFGSYYTPDSLIDALLESTLAPLLDEAADKPTAEEAERAILSMKVCDPACGSGHFLIAAARRMGRRLADIRGMKDDSPSCSHRKQAVRDVVDRCVFGVDIDPISVELCKANLWLESMQSGEPPTALDEHIQCGNALFGATPELLEAGIPGAAFKPIADDDKAVAREMLSRNRSQRRAKQTLGETSPNKLAADAWCAAFVWKKTRQFERGVTEDIFRRISRYPTDVEPSTGDEIRRLAEQYRFFHWHLAFPEVFAAGGFDVILANPPWEHVELKEREWFANRSPEISKARTGARRKRLIEQLAGKDPQLHARYLETARRHEGLAHFLANSGRYPLCGRGRINMYAAFAETMRALLAVDGRLGCVLPTGIATDHTTRAFFEDLMRSRSLLSLCDFENKKGLFPAVDGNMKFCLLVCDKQRRDDEKRAEFVFFARDTTDAKAPEKRFTLSSEDIELLNPNTRTCPVFRSRRDAELTKAIYRRVPILIRDDASDGNPWGICFRQGLFNMTSASHLFLTRERLQAEGWTLEGNRFHRGNETCLPLYEAKMIHHFDHRFADAGEPKAGAHIRGSSEQLSAEQHADPTRYAMPRSWVRQSAVEEALKSIGWHNRWFLGFRNVTGNVANVRTAVFALAPYAAVGNSMPLVFPSKSTELTLALAANLSSFVFDFAARQKVGGVNLNFYIVKQLPVLPPERYIERCRWADGHQTVGQWLLPRVLELAYTSWDLQSLAKDFGHDGPPFGWNEDRRHMLRCEIDAAYFQLYGIEREDVAYIMDSFPGVERRDVSSFGEYRTKHTVLDIHDAMAARIANHTM